jgi:hypothetical protein
MKNLKDALVAAVHQATHTHNEAVVLLDKNGVYRVVCASEEDILRAYWAGRSRTDPLFEAYVCTVSV